jgi:hypothetical protein
MARRAGAVAICLALAPVLAAAQACEPPPGFGAATRVESRDTVLLYRTNPARIAVGEHFTVDAIVCPKSLPAPTGIRVDAQMPAHRHGMNYRARVAAKGDGRFVAEGLLFHMPGRWQFAFDVERPGRVERLTHDLVVE